MADDNKVVHTDVDLLIELVKEKKEISVDQAAEALGLPLQTVEQLADYLDEEGVISIRYKLTTEYLYYQTESDAKKEKVREEIKEIEQLFEELDKEITAAFKLINQKQFKKAHEEYKRIHQSAKKIHNTLKQDSKDMPSIDHYNFLVRVENIEHLLDHLEGLMDTAEEQRITSAFNKVHEDIKDLFADLKLMYNKVTEFKVSEREKKLTKRNELLKRLQMASKGGEESSEDKEVTGSEDSDKASPEEILDAVAKLSSADGKFSAVPTLEIKKEFEELISQAMQLVEEGNYEKAKILYEQINKLYTKLPTEYKDKRMKINNKLLEINQKLGDSVNASKLKTLKNKKLEVDELIKKFYEKLEKKDVNEAQKLFEQAEKVFRSFPPGITTITIETENKIVKAHESLLETENQVFSDRVLVYKKKIAEMINTGVSYLDHNDIASAIKTYREIKKLYHELPSGYLATKTEIQEEIFNFYKKLINLYKNDLYYVFKKKSSTISKILVDIEIAIKNQELDLAYNLLNKTYNLFETLPGGFLKEKSDIEKKILQLSTMLSQMEKEIQAGDFEKKSAKIAQLLDMTKKYMSNSNFDLARETYFEMVHLFNHLPIGFYEKKKSMRESILTVYKDIIKNHDEEFLADSPKSLKNTYEALLRKIVETHHLINDGEFDDLEGSYKAIIELYNCLPIGVVQQRMKVRDEIVKLYDCLQLYRKVKEIDDLIRDEKFSEAKLKVHELTEFYKEIHDELNEDKPLLDYVRKKLSQHHSFIDSYMQVGAVKGLNFELLKDQITNDSVKSTRDDNLLHLINSIVTKDVNSIKEISKSSGYDTEIHYMVDILRNKNDPNIKNFLKGVLILKNRLSGAPNLSLLRTYISAYYSKIHGEDRDAVEKMKKVNMVYPEISL